jgi:hypothetical protein
MNAERRRTARPRLMMVVNDLGFLGSHRRPVALVALESGYEVFVATPGWPQVAELERTGLRHVTWRVWRGSAHPLWEIRSVWSLARAFRKVRPHIAHLVTIKPVALRWGLGPSRANADHGRGGERHGVSVRGGGLAPRAGPAVGRSGVPVCFRTSSESGDRAEPR